ncbi:uncharacterized protein FOMMEDRAFT_146634 [Fomitiporia mediterranea MF3/22]|uniref:uncharacterized protein n=1 Tax=Fomitiporia mediterranea (strain MF3/22) TaxID=694068 RepID=UPI0004407423|nr:uncharacterized protein FOMMEDRAFT_146634 [Fomitiporia mediterranea MF3/22]EJD02820.1 hypothetical protein FOMMEDRAFT_146634 [Fomitiporia mediterranea MF3/22]
MSEPAFYRIPPEIWDRIIVGVGRRDLAALAVTSRQTYPIANPLLYQTLELSFCKCSEAYYNALARTIIDNAELASLIRNLYIDMKVPCRVKTAGSVDNFHSTRTWRTQYRPHLIFLPGRVDDRNDPKSRSDWNREAAQTLLDPQVSEILAHLSHIDRISVILGHFQQDSEILLSLFNALPEEVLPSLQLLKISDASIVTTASFGSMNSLRVLDLGYSAVDDLILCDLVSQNVGTLEEIHLNWIMESQQRPLFTGYSGGVIKGLKAFTSQGPHAFSFDGIKKLFGEASLLEDFRLESLSLPSAMIWNRIFTNWLASSWWKLDKMRVLKFGAAAGCKEFWDSVAQFLVCCGSGLISLGINGSPRGPTGPFPTKLIEYFAAHTQPMLKTLVVMWRDDLGLPPVSSMGFTLFAPSLEMLHICFSVPADLVNSLLNLIAPFSKLRRVHFTFLKRTNAPDINDAGKTIAYSKIFASACGDIAQKGPMFQEFVKRAAVSHPELAEVSWSIYDRITYSAEGPKAYVKINRSNSESPDPNSLLLEDLGDKCRKYESNESMRFRCTVGTKKVLLNQKPGWREDMGNPFLETHRVCQYAEFNEGSNMDRLRRREL